MESVELVDPQKAVEAKCEPQCATYYVAYQDCAKRIEGKQDAHCTGQYLDYMACVDHCVRLRALRATGRRKAPRDAEPRATADVTPRVLSACCARVQVAHSLFQKLK